MGMESRGEGAVAATVMFAMGVAMGCGGSGAAGDAGSTLDAHRGEDAGPASGPVVELAIRRLNEGQDVAEFEAAREASCLD